MADREHVMRVLEQVQAKYVGNTGSQNLAYILPTGTRWVIPNTPSDHRSWANNLASLKREVRDYLPKKKTRTLFKKHVRQNHLHPGSLDITPSDVELKGFARKFMEAGYEAPPAADPIPPKPRHYREYVRQERVCRVATPEFLARANVILKEEGPAAYQEFLAGNRQELKEKIVPLRKTMHSVPVQKPIQQQDSVEQMVIEARKSLQTIDKEIQAEEEQFQQAVRQHNANAQHLQDKKKTFKDFVDASEMLQDQRAKVASFIKIAPQPEPQPAASISFTGLDIITDCADLLIKAGKGGVTSAEIYKELAGKKGLNFEQAVSYKTVHNSLQYLITRDLLERADRGMYRFTEEGKRRSGR